AKRRTLPCAHRPCSHPPLRIAGQCRYCTHTYCAKHRLPETHACQELGTCRQQAVQKLGQRLMGEKCVASKM
ncbi:nuclear protein, partial [Phlyctochytrium arcticum]